MSLYSMSLYSVYIKIQIDVEIGCGRANGGISNGARHAMCINRVVWVGAFREKALTAWIFSCPALGPEAQTDAGRQSSAYCAARLMMRRKNLLQLI